jgi:PAS domain S-box-containing protein
MDNTNLAACTTIVEPFQQVIEQVQYQSLLLNTMRDAVVAWDHAGSITFWNSAAEALFHVTPAECIGKNVRDVFLPSFQPPLPVGQPFSPATLTTENTYTSPGGKIVWVSSHITQVSHPDYRNVLPGYLCVSRDILAHKSEIEETLKNAQTRLAQATRMAFIGELASGVAHQMSNPLTTIIADAQLLIRDPDVNGQRRESAEAILQAGWRAQSVINELMKFTQGNNGTSQEPVSVNQTLQAALLFTSAQLQATGIKLEIRLGKDLPQINANPRQLIDLWVNLLLLARSAIKDQENHQILLQTRLDEQGSLVISIGDDGIPIPEEQHERIFEPRLIPTCPGRGSGIELSICREIVLQNNGRITLCTEGRETTFHIFFQPIENPRE